MDGHDLDDAVFVAGDHTEGRAVMFPTQVYSHRYHGNVSHTKSGSSASSRREKGNALVDSSMKFASNSMSYSSCGMVRFMSSRYAGARRDDSDARMRSVCHSGFVEALNVKPCIPLGVVHMT